MVRIRPSLVLQFGIPKDLDNDAVLDECKRSFSYIAPVLPVEVNDKGQVHVASSNDQSDEGACFVIPVRMTIRLHQPYWNRDEEREEELWLNAMEPWLNNMFKKLSGAMKAFSAMEHPGVEGRISFNPLEIQFYGNEVVTVELSSDSSIPENALKVVNACRAQGGK